MRFRRRRKRLAPGEFPEHVTRAYVRQTLPSATPAAFPIDQVSERLEQWQNNGIDVLERGHWQPLSPKLIGQLGSRGRLNTPTRETRSSDAIVPLGAL